MCASSCVNEHKSRKHYQNDVFPPNMMVSQEGNPKHDSECCHYDSCHIMGTKDIPCRSICLHPSNIARIVAYVSRCSITMGAGRSFTKHFTRFSSSSLVRLRRSDLSS